MKVSIITSSVASWRSCSTIKDNLLKTYLKFLEGEKHEYQIVYLDESASESDTFLAVSDVCKFEPDTISFLSQLPVPICFFHYFNSLNDKKRPNIAFHIYGSYIANSDLWNQCEGLLFGYNVKFFSASEKQRLLVGKTLNDEVQSALFPFPMEYPNLEELFLKKEKAKKEFGIKKDEKLLIYTGRLSFQKNIYELIDNFCKFCDEFETSNVKLLLAGDFDNIWNPLLGEYVIDGFYECEITKLIESFPPQVRKKVEFLGNIDHQKLQKLYLAADIFLSFSVHNDEDYGISPAEALSFGCDVILSDWAGFSSFCLSDKMKESFLSVKRNGKRNEVDFSNFKNILKEKLEKEELLQDKLERVNLLKNYNSVESLSKILGAELKNMTEFRGYSELMKNVSFLYVKKRWAPFVSYELKDGEEECSFNDEYRELYEVYY